MKKAFALLALSVAVVSHAQSGYSVTLTYDRPGLTVPHWQLALPETGSATYAGKPEKGIDPGAVAVPISDAGRASLGSLLAGSNGLQPCETHSKGIASMGIKNVTFTPSGQPSVHCAFNYTDNKPLAEAAQFLIAISETVQIGLDLERLHRYDRLGLDAMLARLQGEVKEHGAAEIGAIRPVLQALVDDQALMDRVRSRAQVLLDLADAGR